MAVFRKIPIEFWQDDFILDLEPLEKYFFLYLLTNSKTKQCGIYQISKQVMVFETKLNEGTIAKYLGKLIERKKINYNQANSEIMIINWLKHNWSSSSKVIACMKKELKYVKTEEFKTSFYKLCIEHGYSIDTLSKEEEEKQEKEKEEEPSPHSDIHGKAIGNSDHEKIKNQAYICCLQKDEKCNARYNDKGLQPKCIVCLKHRKEWKETILKNAK